MLNKVSTEGTNINFCVYPQCPAQNARFEQLQMEHKIGQVPYIQYGGKLKSSHTYLWHIYPYTHISLWLMLRIFCSSSLTVKSCRAGLPLHKVEVPSNQRVKHPDTTKPERASNILFFSVLWREKQGECQEWWSTAVVRLNIYFSYIHKIFTKVLKLKKELDLSQIQRWNVQDKWAGKLKGLESILLQIEKWTVQLFCLNKDLQDIQYFMNTMLVIWGNVKYLNSSFMLFFFFSFRKILFTKKKLEQSRKSYFPLNLWKP